ncbi:GAF domain-containing sensor histidine kinase [Mucilaginibacter sp.]
MTHSRNDIQSDIDAINSIDVVPTILEVICRTTGMGFAAVARVTDEKWVACSVLDEIEFGLKPGGELKLETTICNEIRQSGDGVVIDHVEFDEDFNNHHTPAMYGFQSYISMPINRKDGSFFGTLCAIDPRPAKLNTPEVINMFKLYSELIAFHLNTIDQLAATKSQLKEELETAELREQFIAILGHDLRNPVGAISNSIQLLERNPLDERTSRLTGIIKNSSYRIRGLIDNMMDFASGRLGGGISLKRLENQPVEDILNHVISELQVVAPEREIIKHFELTEKVNCDGKRIAQLFSNLLGNAFTHGKLDAPIQIYAVSKEGELEISIANAGKKIPDSAMKILFQPFSRSDAKSDREGLGLGLYIASEIAKAHEGSIIVKSTAEETRFTFNMPLK